MFQGELCVVWERPRGLSALGVGALQGEWSGQEDGHEGGDEHKETLTTRRDACCRRSRRRQRRRRRRVHSRKEVCRTKKTRQEGEWDQTLDAMTCSGRRWKYVWTGMSPFCLLEAEKTREVKGKEGVWGKKTERGRGKGRTKKGRREGRSEEGDRDSEQVCFFSFFSFFLPLLSSPSSVLPSLHPHPHPISSRPVSRFLFVLPCLPPLPLSVLLALFFHPSLAAFQPDGSQLNKTFNTPLSSSTGPSINVSETSLALCPFLLSFICPSSRPSESHRPTVLAWMGIPPVEQ